MSQPHLHIYTFQLGPAVTNAYLVGDPASQTAVVIDPAWDGERILAKAEAAGWRITNLWLTHAHFDHFGGAAALADGLDPAPPVALHPADHPLWRLHGGAAVFGFQDFDPGPEPTIALEHGMQLRLGDHRFEVRHTPGHTPGHVAFLLRGAGILFCGDLIFLGSVGRTDLPGGDTDVLLKSIRQEVLSLPDETRLLSGHGPETTVGQERRSNPFLRGLS
jgi:glyoxylase-like metal-dependent hydrolase (beta-lactamase superfamily II)